MAYTYLRTLQIIKTLIKIQEHCKLKAIVQAQPMTNNNIDTTKIEHIDIAIKLLMSISR